jgi:hypothetical protein
MRQPKLSIYFHNFSACSLYVAKVSAKQHRSTKGGESTRLILTSHTSLTGFSQYILLNMSVLKAKLENVLKSSGGRPLLGTPEKASLTHDSNVSIDI